MNALVQERPRRFTLRPWIEHPSFQLRDGTLPLSWTWIWQAQGRNKVKWRQRRSFIFGALGYFKLGTLLLEGLRRMMSYKLALHVLVTFTEKVVPIHKHITLFSIPSISGTKTVTVTRTKRQRWKLCDHTPITYSLSTLSHWPRVVWKMDLGVLFHTLYATITNSQRNKQRIFVFIHFNPSRSLFYARSGEPAGQMRPAWKFNMASIRIFITQVTVKHRVKTKLRDKQTRRQWVKTSLSLPDLLFLYIFLSTIKEAFQDKIN